MNTYNHRRIRPLLWGVAAAFALTAGAAHARPTDPPWPAVTPSGPPTCGKLWKAANHGPGTGAKAIYVVDRELAPCPREKAEKPTGYGGPRNTIPLRK